MAEVLVVAPSAGAWIETLWDATMTMSMPVTPPAGAWIETIRRKSSPTTLAVAPLGERGLKRLHPTRAPAA